MLGAELGTANNVQSMVDGCVTTWESSLSQDELSILTITTEKSIGYFSTINLVCVATETLPNDVATENSRNPAEIFVFWCKN
jgi:hypothetical protein